MQDGWSVGHTEVNLEATVQKRGSRKLLRLVTEVGFSECGLLPSVRALKLN